MGDGVFVNYIVQFKCPECGGPRLDNLTTRVDLTMPVETMFKITHADKKIDNIYGINADPEETVSLEQIDFSGAESTYCCRDCDFELGCGSSEDSLFAWLDKHGMLEELEDEE